MKHDDFRKAGMVSVWIGNFTTETAFDEYLNLTREFESDFGFELNAQDTLRGRAMLWPFQRQRPIGAY